MVDWNQVLIDLAQQGYSVRMISVEVDIPKSTIFGYKNVGAQPKYDDGKRLIQLWCEVLQRAESDIPSTLLA